ncbi:MAG: M16 family metallopeptidase [Bradymonadaceae bacterium]
MDLTTFELDNGLTVILQPKPTAPVVACNVWVGVGSADETDEEAGIAHVHEHMLFKGTDRRDVGEIAREVEAAGGRINAFTSFDHTCYFVAMSSRYLDTGLDILSDAIQNSSFDADELDNELEVIREEIKRGKDNPSRTASLKLFETAYEHHPYRLPVIGTKESVSSFTREDVYGFFQTHYVPDNMALVLAGDFERDEAREKIEEYFGEMAREGNYEAPERETEPVQESFRGWTDRRDIQQTQLRMGFHIPDATDEDIPALDLLSAILGHGDASHLTQTIQRQRQWVNAIKARTYTPEDAGMVIVSGNYQLDEEGDRSHGDTVRGILEEIFRFREMNVSKQDLERARTMIESQEIYGKQTVQGLAMKLGHYQMVTGDPEYEQEYYDQLGEVTPADIRRVAREYLTPDNCSVVLMHPETDEEVTVESLAEQADRAHDVVRQEALEARLEPDDDGFVKIELTDGPTLIIQQDDSVETFAIRGLGLGGVRYEPEGQSGVNKLLSQLLTRGTDNRTAVEISHEVESMAGSLSGMSGRNTSGLKMSGLSRFFEESFEIFADCLMNAEMPDEEFGREQRILLERIKARRDKLAAVSLEQFQEAFFAPHPYSRPKSGRAEEVAELTPEDVRAFHDRIVRPRDLVLSVVGDIDPGHVARLAERYFVDPEGPSVEAPEFSAPGTREEPALVTGDLDKEQAHVVVGFDAPTVSSEDRYALRALYAVLSGQGGRLFYQLRDRESLAYSVHAKPILGLDTSTFAVMIGTSPEKIEQAVSGIYREIERVRDEGISDDELARAKRYLIGNHDIGLQKNSSRALSIGLDELYDLGYKRSLQFGDYIEEVTREDVRRVAQEYLQPESSVASVIKPGDVEVPGDLAESAAAQGRHD